MNRGYQSAKGVVIMNSPPEYSIDTFSSKLI